MTELPQAVAAERAVLTLAISSAPDLAALRRLIKPSDFHQPRHAEIFGAACDLADNSSPVEPVAVMNELTRTGNLTRVGGAGYLHELYALPISRGTGTHYAMQVRTAARERAVLQVGQRLIQLAEEAHGDEAPFIDNVARQMVLLEVLLDARAEDEGVPGVQTWDDFLAVPDSPADWVVPELIERQDVVMILGGEGDGKSWLDRQICLAVAAGVHPFRPNVHIEAKSTLLVDLENAESMVRRQSRPLLSAIVRHGEWVPERAHIWARPDGLNLRKPADAQLLEQVVADTRPALVGLGSLYKAFQRGRDDWDTAASEAREVLDRIRRRHRCAFILEHHMPKGDGLERPRFPFGSSEWQRWVSHGRVMTRIGPNAWELAATFRQDRDLRDYPLGLTRGGEFPWSPIYDLTELEYLREQPEAGPRRNH